MLVEASISADDDLWRDTDLKWKHEVGVRLRAAFAGTGELVARGDIRGTLLQECRRCLKPVETRFEDELTLVFVSEASIVNEDDSSYTFDPTAPTLDMSRAVREEVVLATNPYVVCDPDCLGLCATCGADLNEGPCDCTEDKTDPRWAALRELKDE